MATGPAVNKHDLNLEVPEPKKQAEKKKRPGKFQPFRKLFGKKKKREVNSSFHGEELKTSECTREVCHGLVSDEEDANQNLRDLNPIGSRSLSHDSVFIPEDSAKQPTLEHAMSQENVSDKVRNLQKQIASIKFGQKPPSLRKSEEDDGSSEDEEAPQSPLKVMVQVEAEPVHTEVVEPLMAQAAHSTPVKSPRSKRVLPPTGTIESINLDAVPQSVPRLDNAAAKHKMSIKPKNQRVSRKHRRFTQEHQDVSIPGVLQEELETASVSSDVQRRTSSAEDELRRQRLQEEERLETERKLEEQRLRQLEKERHRLQDEQRLRREEEEKRLAERRRLEEEKRIREEEEKRRLEEEEERRRCEEQQRREEEERRMREEQECQRREEEERKLIEEIKRREEEKRQEEELRRQQVLEAERVKKQKEDEDRKKNEKAVKKKMQEIEERKKKAAEERKEEGLKRLSSAETDRISDPQESKRRAEELRWREMEERQKPFSFKVSSGEKQILFQKVNLTPVTPPSSQQGGTVTDQRDSVRASSGVGVESPNLPTSQCVPHTAILVTGAQLCGTAVNMDQIKDPACKSLLGLGEDRKAQGTPPMSKTSPDRQSGKTKSLTETSPSSDSVLVEWATIRSKIFKGVEDGKYEEQLDQSKNQPSSNPEEQSAFAHMNLRKTMSASPKFSITPAKKKFGDSNRNSEVLSVEDADEDEETGSCGSPAASRKAQNRTSKTVRISERGSEEFMFAKDLPSFLVPTSAASGGDETRTRGHSETEAMSREDEEGSEEKPSPFGIKLRRTNFSLRFHSEQSTEKRKKRYSAGDSFDGVPSPLTPIDPDGDASLLVFSDKSSSPSPPKESVMGKYLHTPPAHTKPRKSSCDDSDKAPSKSSLYRRPATSPKPTAAAPTPPLSPMPKSLPRVPSEVQRQGGRDSPGQDRTPGSEGSTAVSQLQRSSSHFQAEEEPKEKRSFFPSINIPWREKVDRKTELKREKPSLQSRHSLDSSKVQDKEAGPLWITLALQKQKGFREQQQSREERRSQREAKLAEKHARDSVSSLSPTDSRGSPSPGSKPQTPEEPKRPDSLLGRFERRELKKSNTLPSSVTVEISDSTPSPPAVKDVSKRFPSSDSTQVSTEPAWLALAKRKAKAWSDCPQIIK